MGKLRRGGWFRRVTEASVIAALVSLIALRIRDRRRTAAINAAIAERRADPEFMARLRNRLMEDLPVLERLRDV